MEMLTLYLRKEYKTEWVNGYPVRSKVVAYYRDKEMKEFLCKNPWQSAPTRRNKYVMYNCNKYKCEWLPDKVD